MVSLDRYVSRGVLVSNRQTGEERGEEIGLLHPFICHWLQILLYYSEDDVLTSFTFGRVIIMGHMSGGH